jgi:hypothetical protein
LYDTHHSRVLRALACIEAKVAIMRDDCEDIGGGPLPKQTVATISVNSSLSTFSDRYAVKFHKRLPGWRSSLAQVTASISTSTVEHDMEKEAQEDDDDYDSDYDSESETHTEVDGRMSRKTSVHLGGELESDILPGMLEIEDSWQRVDIETAEPSYDPLATPQPSTLQLPRLSKDATTWMREQLKTPDLAASRCGSRSDIATAGTGRGSLLTLTPLEPSRSFSPAVSALEDPDTLDSADFGQQQQQQQHCQWPSCNSAVLLSKTLAEDEEGFKTFCRAWRGRIAASKMYYSSASALRRRIRQVCKVHPSLAPATAFVALAQVDGKPSAASLVLQRAAFRDCAALVSRMLNIESLLTRLLLQKGFFRAFHLGCSLPSLHGDSEWPQGDEVTLAVTGDIKVHQVDEILRGPISTSSPPSPASLRDILASSPPIGYAIPLGLGLGKKAELPILQQRRARQHMQSQSTGTVPVCRTLEQHITGLGETAFVFGKHMCSGNYFSDAVAWS